MAPVENPSIAASENRASEAVLLFIDQSQISEICTSILNSQELFPVCYGYEISNRLRAEYNN